MQCLTDRCHGRSTPCRHSSASLAIIADSSGFDAIVTPLTRLLSKDGFQLDQKAESAFRALQRALMEAPLVQLPNFQQEFVVECDATGLVLKAVL
jgi:hypothetical protein